MKQAKLGLIIVCLLAAAVLFWINSAGPDSIPDTSESSTTWMCDKCKKISILTVLEAVAEEKRAGGSPPFICSSCSAKAVYRVAQCETCATYYFSSDVPGSLGRCPTCFPPNSLKFPDSQEEIETNDEPAPPSV